jgi:hypothetical protein
MAEFRIEDAAFAGFGLLARKPLAVLTWALVYLVFLAVVIVPFAGGLVAFITTVAKSGSNPDPSAMLAGMSGLFGMILLLFLGSSSRKTRLSPICAWAAKSFGSCWCNSCAAF